MIRERVECMDAVDRLNGDKKVVRLREYVEKDRGLLVHVSKPVGVTTKERRKEEEEKEKKK